MQLLKDALKTLDLAVDVASIASQWCSMAVNVKWAFQCLNLLRHGTDILRLE